MNVEAVRAKDDIAFGKVVANFVLENFGLDLVRQKHYDDVALLRRLGGGDRLETVGNRLLVVRRSGQIGDEHVQAVIPQVLGVSVTLRSVSENRDRLVFKKRKISVLVVVNSGWHG